MFSRTLPLEIAARCWDFTFLALCTGQDVDAELFLFRAALALLRLLQRKLRGLSMGDALRLLKEAPSEMDEKEFMHSVRAVTLDRKAVAEMLQEAKQNATY